MALGCQSPLRGPVEAPSTCASCTTTPGILVYQHWRSSPSEKRPYYPHLSHSAGRISAAALSRVMGIPRLFAPEWQQIGLWTPPPQPTGKRTAGHDAQAVPPS